MTTLPAGATASGDPSADDAAAGATSPPPGAFERLAAFDGLFLRSEHLNLIEDYAFSIATAVGAASGPGIVWGFEVTLSDGTLSVSPGLAIMDDGTPLRTTDVLSRKIDDLTVATGIYYVVQLGWDDWPEGEEAVQGVLCDSGCDCEHGAVRSSRLLEGPVLMVDAVETVPELAAHQKTRRSWLASYLFREEEQPHRRWPNEPKQLPVAWPPMPPPRVRDTVQLAVLLPPTGDGAWELDTWMVRRDRGAPPPARHWEWRLRMRPWDVFVAQVLQFQAQLADESRTLEGDANVAEMRERLSRHAQEGKRFAKEFKGKPHDTGIGDFALEAGWINDALAQFAVVQYSAERQGGPALAPGQRCVELPPGGFVWCEANALDEIKNAVESYLGSPEIVRRVCRCSLGDVGRVLHDAQHRDRTRTASHDDGGETEAIDVYVPSRDQQRLTSWVLFTRTERVECLDPDAGRTARSTTRSSAKKTTTTPTTKTTPTATKKTTTPPVKKTAQAMSAPISTTPRTASPPAKKTNAATTRGRR